MAGKYPSSSPSPIIYEFGISLAGSSMVHPNVPAMVICPICPHSLSFRPIVVPAGIELKVKVSEETRLTAWLSVDGRNRHELQQQDR